MMAKESAITLMLHVQCFVCSSLNLWPLLFFLFPSSSLWLLELASSITGKRILEVQQVCEKSNSLMEDTMKIMSTRTDREAPN